MVTIVPPARAVWLDLSSRTERLLEPGEHELGDGGGFVWVDVELPAGPAVAALAASGLVPEGIAVDADAAGSVGSAYGPDHLQVSLTGARLEGDRLVLDRREILVTAAGVVTLHRGLPTHFDDLRARYQDGFQRFARSHGFLLFELVGHLADGLQARGPGPRRPDRRSPDGGGTAGAAASDDRRVRAARLGARDAAGPGAHPRPAGGDLVPALALRAGDDAAVPPRSRGPR